MHGEQFVKIIGIVVIQLWLVNNWDITITSLITTLPTMDKELDLYGWIICTVEVVKLACSLVHQMELEITTVVIGMMLV